jgi:F-type H+-transporting ATPase subunit delta
VTNKNAANRYARGLFVVALKEKVDLQAVAEELAAFAGLLGQYPELKIALFNPAVPAPRKRAAVERLVATAKIEGVLAKLLVLLAERDRLTLLPDISAAYDDRLLEHQKVVRAEVTTAAPLPPERTDAIEKSLAAITGSRVRLSAKVEPSMIGGLVARVGGTVYDASVATQLERMKRRLTETR